MSEIARRGDGMHRAAVLAFPDETGEPAARLVLERAPDVPPPVGYREGRGHRTAAWLMCNPSRATHLIDDPTAGRVVHHSRRAGCPRSLLGNVWPLRTPYPADLWRYLQQCPGGTLPPEWESANLDALAMISGQADIHVVAYGAAVGRDHRVAVARALEAFSLYGTVPLYCLGMTADGQPLHPLARGKLAVRNDAELQLWRPANDKPLPTWDQVFADKRRIPGGWVDR